MHRHELTEEQRQTLEGYLPNKGRGRPSIMGTRVFVHAVIWIAKTGSPWRDMPTRFGNWKSIYNRFSNWSKRGILEKIFKKLASEGHEKIGSLLDGSIVRAHQDSAGGRGTAKKSFREVLWWLFYENSCRSRYKESAASY
jgi:transposase